MKTVFLEVFSCFLELCYLESVEQIELRAILWPSLHSDVLDHLLRLPQTPEDPVEDTELQLVPKLNSIVDTDDPFASFWKVLDPDRLLSRSRALLFSKALQKRLRQALHVVTWGWEGWYASDVPPWRAWNILLKSLNFWTDWGTEWYSDPSGISNQTWHDRYPTVWAQVWSIAVAGWDQSFRIIRKSSSPLACAFTVSWWLDRWRVLHGSGADRGALERYPGLWRSRCVSGRPGMADKQNVIPSWDGNPTTFETYVTAAKWFEKGTKASDRPLVVARLWSQLTGAAKSVVKHLDPDSFEGSDGLQQFLQVLRQSPLQQLPVPDSFSRLERWRNLKRSDKESIAELIVREEELFQELQQSLVRARSDRGTSTSSADAAASPVARDPPSTPGRSPTANWNQGATTGAPRSMYPSFTSATVSSGTGLTTDFFEDELRGYRLLRSSRISGSERQNVLVQTGNSTSFLLVRRALRTLFSEETERHDRHVSGRSGRIWFEDFQEDDNGDDMNADQLWWSDWYGNDWDSWSAGSSPTYWQDDDSWAWISDWSDWNAVDELEEVAPDNQATEPEEIQLNEAFQLANEANKTLKDAREAVRRVRQARGYYASESNSGKGIVPSSAATSGKGGSPNSGACFRCGMKGHSYVNCPDRFAGKSKGKMFSKSSGKGFGKSFKGKGKGKSNKGKTFFMDLDCILSAWDADATHGRDSTRAIIDTGAAENAIGLDSLHDLVSGGKFDYKVDCTDLPTFRFGNGQKDQAVSRVDLAGTSLGDISFYVLGGMACKTPPLIGAKTLRGKSVSLSYNDGLFRYYEPNRPDMLSVQMKALKSGHVTLDLSEAPRNPMLAATTKVPMTQSLSSESSDSDSFHTASSSLHELQIHMFAVECHGDPPPLSDRLQQLASRIQRLRSSVAISDPDGGASGNSSGRPAPPGISMLRIPQEDNPPPESTRLLDFVQPMRPADELCVQGRCPRTDKAVPAGAQLVEGNNGSSGDHIASGPVHREDCERQDDGDQRIDVAERSDPDHGNADDLEQVPRLVPEGHDQSGNNLNTDHASNIVSSGAEGNSASNSNADGTKCGCIPHGREPRASTTSGADPGSHERGHSSDRHPGSGISSPEDRDGEDEGQSGNSIGDTSQPGGAFEHLFRDHCRHDHVFAQASPNVIFTAICYFHGQTVFTVWNSRFSRFSRRSHFSRFSHFYMLPQPCREHTTGREVDHHHCLTTGTPAWSGYTEPVTCVNSSLRLFFHINKMVHNYHGTGTIRQFEPINIWYTIIYIYIYIFVTWPTGNGTMYCWQKRPVILRLSQAVDWFLQANVLTKNQNTWVLKKNI